MKTLALITLAVFILQYQSGRQNHANPSAPEPPLFSSRGRIEEELAFTGIKKQYVLSKKTRSGLLGECDEHALLLLEREDGKWELVHAVRLPLSDSSTLAKWHLYETKKTKTAPGGLLSRKQFETRPTQADADQFVTLYQYKSPQPSGRRTVFSKPDLGVWFTVFGTMPN